MVVTLEKAKKFTPQEQEAESSLEGRIDDAIIDKHANLRDAYPRVEIPDGTSKRVIHKIMSKYFEAGWQLTQYMGKKPYFEIKERISE